LKSATLPLLGALAAASLLLSACEEAVTLKSDTGGADMHGRVTLNSVPPHFIDIDLNGHRYHGAWTPVKVEDPSTRGIKPNFTDIHHQHVSGSFDADPVTVVKVTLTAPDAPPLECTWLRYVGSVSGVCALPSGENWTFQLD